VTPPNVLDLRRPGGGAPARAAALRPAAAFFEQLHAAVAAGPALALAVVDIAGFHAVNEEHGFAAADRLLDGVAARLAGRLRAGDLAVRLGGDAFALLLRDVHDAAEAVAAAHEVLGSLRDPFLLGERPVGVSARIGLALCPQHGRDPRALLHDARTALAGAREAGIDIALARPAARKARPAGEAAAPPAADLRDGLLRGEFGVHYQPIHDFDSGAVEVFEALVRWRHPLRGLLEPAAFLPMAERAGLAHAISLRVLDCACDSLRTWRARGHRDLRVAVNFSPHDLGRDGFADLVASTLARHGLPPAALEIELTEHEQLEDEAAVRQVAELARRGVGLTIDDFGVKYSSLRYLQRLPVRALKVDRSFVHDVEQSQASRSIVAAMIGIAGQMGLRLVAEGVERARQLDELRGLGCHLMQGFLFCPPVPADDVAGYLDRVAPRR
jgi:diguanylate cyclase (GGDEF)-like protein